MRGDFDCLQDNIIQDILYRMFYCWWMRFMCGYYMEKEMLADSSKISLAMGTSCLSRFVSTASLILDQLLLFQCLHERCWLHGKLYHLQYFMGGCK